ncbi:hypothetical protein [Candidatus Spongiihabitans sp.]|uniref:hypothetical protein n=1 Tax=Candidatus Spongiihabitans sp. TaxID=3101308 RepID=UPI003C6FF9F2
MSDEGEIMTLEEFIGNIRKALEKGSFPNEASISRQVVEPILRLLGWDTSNPDTVRYEKNFGKGKADIALEHEDRTHVVLEVKKLGSADGAEKQLFEYTYHAGVSLAVLTTGQEWEFYLPLKAGAYQDRQVYKLDISVRSIEESVYRLRRYLSCQDVCNEQAVKMAEEDHKDKARAKDIEDAFPKAWVRILSECDDRLIEILQDKVVDICGYNPDADAVKVFIRTQSEKTMVSPQPPRSAPVVTERKRSPTSGSKKLQGFELHGRRHDARNGVNTLVAVFEELIKLNSSFPDRFMEIHPGGKRRWLASKQIDLYPNRPDLCRDSSRQLSTGHWVSTNYNRETIENIIKAACEVARINYRTDLKILYKTSEP